MKTIKVKKMLYLILIHCILTACTTNGYAGSSEYNSYENGLHKNHELSSIVIVDEPKYGIVTNKIPRKIIGKYYRICAISENNCHSDDYFEIKENGKFIFSFYSELEKKINIYTDAELDLVIYCEKDKRCILEFRPKISSDNIFSDLFYPSICFISLNEYDFLNNEIIIFEDGEGYELYKKVPNIIGQGIKLSHERNISKIEYLPVEIVEKAEYNIVTNEITNSLVGKYVSVKDKKDFLIIYKDGTFLISNKTNKGEYATYTEEDMELVVYYDISEFCQLDFRLKVGKEKTLPDDLLSLSFSYYDGDANKNNVIKFLYGEYSPYRRE